jgi:glycosyltransferase involved in cell wall biosynthesis
VKVMHVEMGRHLYGGARQVAYLLNGLRDYPGEHILVCPPDSGVMRALENDQVMVCPVAMRGDLDVGFVFRLRKMILQHRPDLLHIHSRKGDLPAILAGRLAGVPVIYSRRVDNPPNLFDRLAKFPLCRRVVTISHGILDVLQRSGVPEDKLICIPSAIDTSFYGADCDRAAFERLFGLAPGAPTLGMVAQLIQRKGHAVLFDALALVLPKHPHLRVLIFGQGGLEAELKRDVEARGFSGCVHFAGFRSDLARILPCLDVLVHPAWMEGLGVSLLEAAACGVPIIASRAGGMPEIVKDGVNGFLIEPGDGKALGVHLDQLLSEPEVAKKMGQAGLALVHERFAIAGMVAGNDALYRALTSQ